LKNILLLAVLLALIGAYPLINEDTASSCSAVERRYLALQPMAGSDSTGDSFARALASGVQNLTNGALARDTVKRQHPNLPAAVTCTWYYWKGVIDPEGFKKDMQP
jgi:hypothetical protein